MLQTYKALLRGDRVEWMGPHPSCGSDHPLEVEVTVLEDERPSSPSRGKEMATVLEKLAGCGAFSEIEDPASWQRETREDRALPGRDE